MINIIITELIIEADRIDKLIHIFYPGKCLDSRESVFAEVDSVRMEHNLQIMGSKASCYVWKYVGTTEYSYTYTELVDKFEELDKIGSWELLRYDMYRFSPGEIIVDEQKGLKHTMDCPFIKKITEKGRITIPSDILEHFSIKPGMDIEFLIDEDKDCIVLEKHIPNKIDIDYAISRLQNAVFATELSPDEMAAWKELLTSMRTLSRKKDGE